LLMHGKINYLIINRLMWNLMCKVKNSMHVAQYFLKDPNILRKFYQDNGLNQQSFKEKMMIIMKMMVMIMLQMIQRYN
ncbi:hypothetical protein RhiirC2_728629, partial [Rhizophagus irregularis]